MLRAIEESQINDNGKIISDKWEYLRDNSSWGILADMRLTKVEQGVCPA